MSAPTTHDPLVVNTRDGERWERRAVTSEGRGLYAAAGSCRCPELVMATLAELAGRGIVGQADARPMPVGPEPRTLDVAEAEERQENARLRARIAEPEKVEASAAADVARLAKALLAAEARAPRPRPDALTKVFAPVASLREPEGEHYAQVHHSYRVGHDLPEADGNGR